MLPLRQLYLDRRVLVMLPLGFGSGLPLLLTGGTLGGWARSSGVSLAGIGILGSLTTVYALKFLWAPLLDRFAIPLLDRRRGWLALFQLILAATIFALSRLSPQDDLLLLATMVTLIAFFSASQDIVADAYRIDVLDEYQRGSGAGLFVGGYRIGMIVAGGLAFILVGRGWSWPQVYAAMSACMAIGIIGTLLAPRVSPQISAPATLKAAVIEPSRQLLLRRGAAAMLLFVILFKLPDVLGNNFSIPFLHDIGVSDATIGTIRNTYGLGMTIVGALAGTAVCARVGLRGSLWVFGTLQALSNTGYLLLAWKGPSTSLLLGVISVENFCGGLVTAGFSIYLMAQCDRRYSAYQFALLTSAMALANSLLAPAGWLSDQYGWTSFFLVSIAVAIPGMALIPLIPIAPAAADPDESVAPEVTSASR